jgi:hypothetical protein
MAEHVQLYDSTYGRFELDARQQVRVETYGEDLGQNSWLTTDEWGTAPASLELRSRDCRGFSRPSTRSPSSPDSPVTRPSPPGMPT